MWIREQERVRIRPYLEELRKQAKRLEACVDAKSNHSIGNEIIEAAMERALHIGCECITDIGNIIIDVCIMRDPSSYQDIVTVLHDERVLDDALQADLLPVILFRKSLVHDYVGIDHSKLFAYTNKSISAFTTAADQLEYFIEHSNE